MEHVTKLSAFALIGGLLLLGLPAARAQEGGAEQTFSASQLEQLVAPVALYPDSLLMQVYMAATYPLEVVEADRWLEKNPSLSGEAVDEAMKGFEWDISIKSICHFPEVLTRMADNLDWTRDVGDAFLAQQPDLLDATLRMRQKAYDEGNLKSTQEQVVTVKEEKIIVIEPSSPEVVYVPTYNPTVVYGPAWTYPAAYYPGMYYYPPGAALFTFAAGAMVGAALWGNCNWGWGHSNANVNVNMHNNFNNNTNINSNRSNLSNKGGNRSQWNHSPEHRNGVGYRDNGTAQRFGGGESGNRVSRDQARGYSENRGDRTRDSRGQGDRAGNRQGSDGRGTQGRSDRGSAQQRTDRGTGQQKSDRGSAQQRSGQGSRQSGDRTGRSSSQGRSKDNAFSGSKKGGSKERSSSNRGSASRSGTGKSRSSSGSSRSRSSGSRSRSGGGRRR